MDIMIPNEPGDLVTIGTTGVLIGVRLTSSRCPGGCSVCSVQHLVLPRRNRGCQSQFGGGRSDQVNIIPDLADFGFKTRGWTKLLHLHISEGVGFGNVGHGLGDLRVWHNRFILIHILIVQYIGQLLAGGQKFTGKRGTVWPVHPFTLLQFGFWSSWRQVSYPRTHILASTLHPSPWVVLLRCNLRVSPLPTLVNPVEVSDL